jgi:HlyD family secretion protein
MSKVGRIVGLVAVVGAVGGGVWLWQGGKDAEAPARASTLVEVERRNLEIVAEAAGLVEAVRVVEVKSRASGEVLRVNVESGDKVEGGTLLAEIDPRDVQSALEQAQADLSSARVRWSTSDAHRKRLETLRKTGVVTQQELESAVQASASANAEVVRAETNLRLARERRNDVTIRAPISGTVLERTVEIGQIIASATQNVSGGTTLFKMADLSVMQVRAKIDETDVGQIHPGQDVRVTVEAYPGKTFRGKIAKIEPQAVVEQNVTMFPVLVRLENLEGLLRPGMNASISVQISERTDVATVPNEAVVAPQDAPGVASALGVDPSTLGPGGRLEAAAGGRGGIVFVLTPSGSEARQVVLGLSDWERSEVIEGLEPGETVYLATVARMEAQQEQRIPGPFGGGR